MQTYQFHVKSVEQAKLILAFLAANGIKSYYHDEKKLDETAAEWFTRWPYVQFRPSTKYVNGYNSAQSNAKTLSSFEEVVKAVLFPSQETEVKLNGQYTAVVSKDGIKVGCQTFSFATLDQLVNAAADYRQ